MKKLLSGLLVVLSLNAYGLTGTLKIGGTTSASTYEIKENILDGGSITNEIEKSFENYEPSIAFELTQGLVIADVGLGIAYTKAEIDDLTIIPAYALAKVNLFPVLVKPYFVAKLGVIANTESDHDLDGDVYYGVGIGVNFTMVSTELLYTRSKIGNEEFDQLGLYFGIDLF